nr:hypothetical protein [Alicyclobacillus contaminans]
MSEELERRFVLACGGVSVVQTLIDHLESLIERLNRNNNRLLPA